MERARYWRARTLLERERQRRGRGRLFETLALEHPATYYGLMARERLARAGPGAAGARRAAARCSRRARRALAAATPGPLERGPALPRRRGAAAAGLPRGGVAPSCSPLDRTGLPPEALRLMVHLLSLAGDERSAHARGARVAATGPERPHHPGDARRCGRSPTRTRSASCREAHQGRAGSSPICSRR